VTRTAADLHLPAGSRARGPDPVVVTAADARWRYCGLHVVRLAPGEPRVLELGEREAAVVPLAVGALQVVVDGVPFDLRGRESVFDRVPDYLYATRGATLTLTAPGGGEVGVASAQARTEREPVLLRAEEVSIEVRGAGRATRQVVNFLTPEVPVADRLLCCEVLTPAGGWSSHPPHKHDDAAGGAEAELEEIYYFRLEGEHAFGLHRTYDLEEGWDVTVAVRSGDVFLVPRGYHGPCAASPEHAMWYLNVLAGPGEERSMAISDDPAHAWVRGTWAAQECDARVPLIDAAGRRR
jgi:5-deoxy-glucuronate isomerase